MTMTILNHYDDDGIWRACNDAIVCFTNRQRRWRRMPRMSLLSVPLVFCCWYVFIPNLNNLVMCVISKEKETDWLTDGLTQIIGERGFGIGKQHTICDHRREWLFSQQVCNTMVPSTVYLVQHKHQSQAFIRLLVVDREGEQEEFLCACRWWCLQYPYKASTRAGLTVTCDKKYQVILLLRAREWCPSHTNNK